MTALSAALLALAAAATEAPLSLTASDGSGLTLVALDAQAVVEDPLAFTELHLVFENPRDRVIEGQFRITLPRGAVVSRFAMKLDDRWQEGEVVERQAARRAYEDFLHRRQDPALLEQGAANEFGARVFPIPARGKKELILSYSQELPKAGAAWTLPLKGLPQVGMVGVRVWADGKLVHQLDKKGWTPDRDAAFTPPGPARAGLRSGDLLVARVQPLPASAPDALGSALFLVDTSASRALGFEAQLRLVKDLVGLAAKADPKAKVVVAGFDQAVTKVYEGPASGYGDAAAGTLRKRRALGASDLEGALKWAAGAGCARVVLVSDGVATAGGAEGDLLMAAARGLKAKGVGRLDAVGVGGIRDDATLKQLVTAGLPRDGAVLDGDLPAAALFAKLQAKTESRIAVALDGARFVWPARLDGVQAGDEVLVFAELPAGAPIKLSVGGRAVDLSKGLVSVERPLLERAVVQAKIAALADRIDRAADGPEQKGKLRAEAIALSVKHRVLSPWTALLVLETEADYARFGIDRKALADILTVGNGRLQLTRRAADAVALRPVAPPVPPREAPAKAKKADTGGAPPPSASGAPGPMADPGAPAEALAEADGAAPVQGESELEAKEEEVDARPRGVSRDERPAPRPAPASAAPPPPPSPARLEPPRQRPAPFAAEGGESAPRGGAPWETGKNPYEGRLKSVMDLLGRKDVAGALGAAWGWREESPGDVLALVGLGEALEAKGELAEAARAYGSIVDLFPSRADLRRFAGVRLERVKNNVGLKLAADSFAKAAAQRADHPASHRLLAFALVKLGEYEKAFAAMEAGATRRYPDGRFRGVEQILREDLGLVAAAWMKARPAEKGAILDRLKKAGGVVEDKPSLRFVLNWETDANDVDFHIADAKGGHAFYSQMELPSGGRLYADVTTGYGPECFTIRSPAGKRAGPYRLSAHYYARGPMGYGMGKLQVIEHDGAGGLTFEERPYVVMVDQAFVELGTVAR